MGSPLGTLLYTWLHGHCVGQDDKGIRYYEERKKAPGRRVKRWALFPQKVEATLVPPRWHAWLHHTTEALPESNKPVRFFWQKSRKPNMTGTPQAFTPPGVEGEHEPTPLDYTSWDPPG